MANEKLKAALSASAMKEFNYTDSETVIWNPSQEFEQNMIKLMKSVNKPKRYSLRLILIAAAVIFLLASASLLSIADVREKVIAFFVSDNDTHYDIEYGYDRPGDITVSDEMSDIYTIGGLSADFEIKKREIGEHSAVTIWESGKETIILQQGDGITKRSVDGERLKKTEFTLGNISFTAYSEDGYALLLWNTDRFTFSVDYYGEKDCEALAGMILSGIEPYTESERE